jgi:hypothetical protein
MFLRKLLKYYNLGNWEINIENAVGQTPLIRAIQYERLDLIRLLMEYGANPYAPNSAGRTAIDVANAIRNTNTREKILNELKNLRISKLALSKLKVPGYNENTSSSSSSSSSEINENGLPISIIKNIYSYMIAKPPIRPENAPATQRFKPNINNKTDEITDYIFYGNYEKEEELMKEAGEEVEDWGEDLLNRTSSSDSSQSTTTSSEPSSNVNAPINSNTGLPTNLSSSSNDTNANTTGNRRPPEREDSSQSPPRKKGGKHTKRKPRKHRNGSIKVLRHKTRRLF